MFSFLLREEGWTQYQIFKTGNLTGSSFLVAITAKEESDLFQGDRVQSLDEK